MRILGDATLKDSGYFPLVIEIQDTKEKCVCMRPDDIPKGKEIKVLENNYHVESKNGING